MEEEFKLSISINYDISIEMIDDIMVAAFEGGINYWCKRVSIVETPSHMLETTNPIYASNVVAEGGVVNLFDAESDDSWILNRTMALKGIEMYCKENNVSPEEMYDNHDAETADSIVQYALFNEIVFG